MKKNLSAWGLLWISLTSMIGSGWLFGSLYSAHFAGPAAVLAWPLAGVLLFFVALAYAEVATMFPQENALAQLPLYTHGRLTSILMTGLAWISLATIPVIETQGLVQYSSNYLPGLMTHEGVRYTATSLGYTVALILLLSFVILNYFGIRLFARINAGFTVWKIVIPSVTVIALLTVTYQPKDFSAYGGFMPYGWQGVMAAMSSGGVLFSLLGFRQVVVMMSEIENPGKYVPIVLIASILFTTLLYTALQWSFIGSMREADLVHGWANLSFPGDAGPFAALATFAGLIWLSMLLYSDAFISPFSTGLVYSTTAAYLLASMGEIGNAPKKCNTKNKYNVPWISLLINFTLSATLFLLLRNWQTMVSFLVSVLLISYTVGPISLICLRYQLPHHPRPFRLRNSTLIAFIGFYVCTAGIYWAGYRSNVTALLLTLIFLSSYLIYFYIKKQLIELDIKNSCWLVLYLVFLGIFSYLGNYGGHHILPQYWDLLYLFFASIVIFWLALISRKEDSIVLREIMDYKKASNTDFQGILDLQRKNFIANLTDSEKKDGFLSVEFTKEQFETMNNQTGIVVCKNNDIIYGYLCASSLEFNQSFELPSAMIALYPELKYKDRPLNQYRSIVAGPWCIERDSRGKNIFINMWRVLNEIVVKDIELIITFISIDNLRSLQAAKKIGMEEIATFKFKSNEFCILARMKD